jgi:hypothetical protein
VKPRHAAALALVGWYLLVPPQTPVKGGHIYDEDKNGNLVNERSAPPELLRGATMVHPEAPLAEWAQAGAFDTATACEVARFKLGTSGMRDLAKCIASDDPRLKGK